MQLHCVSLSNVHILQKKYIWIFWTIYQQPIQRPTVGYVHSKAGLLARNQFASGRPRDRPNQSRFSTIFLGPRANAFNCMPLKQPLPKLTSILCLRQNAALHTWSKFRHNAALYTLNSAQRFNWFPLLHISNSPFPIKLPSSLPTTLPCFQSSYTRRTSRNLQNTKRSRFPLIISTAPLNAFYSLSLSVALPRLRRLVADLQPRRSGFDPRS